MSSFISLPEGWTNIFGLSGVGATDPVEEYRRACPGVFVDDTGSSATFAYYDDLGKIYPVTMNPDYIRTDWYEDE